MRVCLASAPTIAEFEDLEPIAEEDSPRIPLGVLCLASLLERDGLRPEVLDLDTLYAAWLRRSGGRGDFARHAVDELVRRDAELYGLSTLCSSYPLTLRIATALKAARPGSRIVLGGPQATVAAKETLAAFPAVDLVVRGEGEAVLPALLEALAGSRDLASVPGLTYRSGDGFHETASPPLLDDLDVLPLPAYHLYPEPRRGEALPVEAGRGCPFACTFCSTNTFFGRRFRLKSPGRLVAEMLTLGRRYGTKRFDLVHDNFTVDRRRVLAFCEAVSAARAGLTWTCSSRTDTIEAELVDVMWKAGCRGFFFGVESGSAAMQRGMGKGLDLTGAHDLLGHVSRRKMTSTVAFITGFPDERREDLDATVSFFVETLRHDHLSPQLSLLSPLTGTPLLERHRHELVLDEIVSDMAFQGQDQDAADRVLIRRHPELFSSFYAVPARFLDREELDELRGFLLHARGALRWLLVAAAQVMGSGLAAFEAFRAWRAAHPRERTPGATAGYHASRAFRGDFVRFVREDLARRHPACGHALRALARYYGSLEREPKAPRRSPRASPRPVRAKDIRLTPMRLDGAALIECLRSGGDLSLVPRRPSTLVTRLSGGRHEILQFGDEAAELLALCDGTRDARMVASAFRRRYPEVGGVPGLQVAAHGLETFRRRGFLTTT